MNLNGTGHSSKDVSDHMIKSKPDLSLNLNLLKSTDLNVNGKGLPQLQPMRSGERYVDGIKKSMLKVKSNYKEFHEEADASSSEDFDDGFLSKRVMSTAKLVDQHLKPDFSRATKGI